MQADSPNHRFDLCVIGSGSARSTRRNTGRKVRQMTAIAFSATVQYFVNAVFNHPTLAECYKVAALNGLNQLRNV